MQLASSRIWTRVAVSIFYDDNHYTTGTSQEVLINKKKTYLQVDFAFSVDQRLKMKESEMIDKYLDLAREVNEL